MVAEHIVARGVADPLVIAALENVPRHAFVPASHQAEAYADKALPLSHGQTLSQPYVVAWMTEALELGPTSRVLEIGTGSGYQTAVLCEITAEVFTIERVRELSENAKWKLWGLGYRQPEFLVGDGSLGWEEKSLFDGILVAAAPVEVPHELLAQLTIGGRLVVPVGPERGPQELRLYRRLDAQRFEMAVLGAVRFVPLVPGSES